MSDLQIGIKITADGSGANSAITSVDANMSRLSKSASNVAQQFQAQTSAVEAAMSSINRQVSLAQNAILSIAAAKPVMDMAKAYFDTAKQLDSLRGMMENVSGSSAAAGSNMDFVKKISSDLGLEVLKTSGAFAKLTAASNGTALQGQSTRDIFAAVSKAASALGLSADETSGALLAVSQMMSKGKVQSEELRGQLGERLPGAFNVAARSMGMTTAEFGKMLDTGQVIAADFLPKFAKALDETYSQGRFDRINNEVNRLSNAWTDLKANLIDTGGVASAIRELTKLMNSFGTDLKASFGTGEDSFKLALEKRIAEQKKVIVEMTKARGAMGPFGEMMFPSEEIAQREQTMREMEQKLSELNQKLAENVAKGTGEAVAKGIQAAAPPKIDQVQQMIAEAAKKYGVPEAFALAIAKTESNFNQGAVSPKGAIGVGQLMPGTAKDLGVDAKDVQQNIDGMMRYIKQIMAKVHGDLRLAAGAYNAGPNNPSIKAGTLPNFAETQTYVKRVSAAYDEFLNKYPGGLPFSDQASQARELKNAEDIFRTHLDAMVTAAENSAKEQVARVRTQEKQLELSRKQAEEAASQALTSAPNEEARLSIIRNLEAAEQGFTQQSIALAGQRAAAEEAALNSKIAALQQELQGSDQFNLSITQRASIEREIAQLQSELAASAESRAQAEIDAASKQLDAEKKIYDLKKKSTEVVDVKEQQLRMNAFWDQMIARIQDYASTWQEISGSTKDGFAVMAVAANNYIKQFEQIGQAYQQMRESSGDSMMLQAAEGAAQAQAAFNLVAKSLISVRDQYEKGSAEYQKYNQAAAGVAVAAKVAAISEGILAVVHQMSSGDPYSAIPRALAVAAMLASMGIESRAGGSSGGSADAARQNLQKTQGSGTVFGDSTAQSESIAKSLEVLKNNSSNNLNYSAAMLRSLDDLSKAMLAIANSITSSVIPGINDAIAQSNIKMGTSMISLFSGFTTKMTDSGIYQDAQRLTNILATGFKGLAYADVTKSFSVMGSELSSKTTTYTQKLGGETANQFTLAIRKVVDALKEGGKAFGLSATDFETRLKDFKVNFGKISLQGMTLDDQNKAISAVFSKMSDKMANKVMPELTPFQQAGEGMFQTFVRVAEGINRANGEMEQLGLTAVKYTEIQFKQGDVAAEIVRKTLQSQAQLSAGVRTYIDQLSGSAEDIIAAYKKLVEASNLMRTAGLNVDNLDRTMINAAGGLDAFTSAMQTFTEKFLSEGERLGGLAATMSRQFMNLGLVMPTSSEGFRALVSGIDTSTDAGKKLFGQVIALSESFSTLQDKIKSVQDKYATVLNPFASIKTQIQSVVTDFNGLIAASAEQIKSTGPFTQQIKDLTKGQFDATASQKDWMQKKIDKQKQIDALEQQLSDTIAKSPGKKKVIADLKNQILMAKVDMMGIDTAIGGFALVISDYDQKIKDAVAANDQALADSLSADKAQKLKDMGAVLVSTIEAFWKSLTDGIKNLQSGIASQIAQLQGPGAVAALARTNATSAMGAVTSYFGGLKPGDTRNIQKELTLIGDAKQAIMDKYNAELALIQEATQAQIDALNTQMQAQVDAINADTEARVKAIQDQLAAEVEAKQKANQAALEGLQKELEAANKLKAAIQAVQNYAKGLALGGNSPLSPEARLMEAQRQYQALLAKAKAGDADAISQLSGASDAYLTAAKAYYGSGTQYSNIFDGVKQAMEQIGGMSAPDPDSIQSHIDQLREQQQKEMDALNKAAQDQITAIQKAAQDQIAALQKDVAQQIKDLQDPNKNAAIQALKDETIKSLEALQELSKSTAEEANRQAQQAYDLALQEFEFSRDQRDYLKSIADSMGLIVNTQQFGSRPMMDPSLIPGHAAGGLASRGLALVGEKGPEIVNFESPGQVLTADETRDALSGNSSEMQALMKEFITEARAIVNVQRAANPQIIEKLDQMAAAFESERRNARIHKAKA